MNAISSPLLRGIIVPMVTPLSDLDRLDVATLERLVEHLIAGGVHGLFLLGTCGEGPSLSYRLRRDLISRTCRQVAGRVSVVAAITDSSAVESAAIGAHAADAGADAVVIAPPFYFPLDDDELVGFVRRLVRSLPLPAVLYNMPSLTKIALAPECVRRLMDDPKIIGLKDSSGDLGYFELLLSLARDRTDWSLLIGSEHLLVPSLQLGGHGGVCGGANVFPRLFVEIFKGATTNSSNGLNELCGRVKTLGQIYECGSGGAPSVVKGLKAALAALGFGNGLLAEPLKALDHRDSQIIAGVVTLMADELCACLGRAGPKQRNG